MRVPRTVFVLLVGLAFALAEGACACSRSAPVSALEPADGAPIDTDLMAYLSEARAIHHAANIKEEERDLPGAVTTLERLVHAKTPHEGSRVPEVEEVLADTYARIGELHLRMGDLSGADAALRAGLEHAPEPTYFRGHLLEVSGIMEEVRAASLADAGMTDNAAAARSRAIGLLNEAVRIQDQVVSRSLGDGGTEGGRR